MITRELLSKKLDLNYLNNEIEDYMNMNLKGEVILFMNEETAQDLEVQSIPIWAFKPDFSDRTVHGIIARYRGYDIYIDDRLRYGEVHIV